MSTFKQILTTPAAPSLTREELNAKFGTREEQDAKYQAEVEARQNIQRKEIAALHAARKAKIANLNSQAAINEKYAATSTKPLAAAQHLAAAANKRARIAKLESQPV
jgi:hypothetical protein